jgi:TRAP-type C4-dicarboxylate transport system permease small subunit
VCAGAPVKRLGAIVESVAAVLLAVVVVIVLVQVFGRYILQISLSWPEELARYVLVWLMFFGVAAASATRSQIVVDTILELVSPRVRRILEGIGALAGLVAVGLLVWTSQALFGPASRSTSPATGIPSFWIYLAIPIGGALLGLFALADLAGLIRGERPPPGGQGASADTPPAAGPGVP